MKKQVAKDELGIAHLGLIVLAVALLAVVGFGVTRVISQSGTNVSVSQKEEDNAIDQANSEDSKTPDEQSDEKIESGDEDVEE